MSREKLMDMDQEQLRRLHTILKHHIPDKTVWAYGFRITRKAGETSDLDLAVFGCDQIEIYDLKEALKNSDLLISVDVMDWGSIPDDFRENIREKYVVLQEKPSRPAGWREVKLGDIVKFNYGKSLPEQKRIAGAIPVYSSAGLIDWHNEALANSKGLIIGRKGTIGSVYKSETPFFPIDTTFYIVESENDGSCNLDYLFYRLSSSGLENLNSDSAVPGLNRLAAYEQKFLLPPLPEQKAIAEVLSSLDDKIDLLHRQKKTLEDIAQTLFRQWFIEFNFPIDSFPIEQHQAQRDEVTNESRTVQKANQSTQQPSRQRKAKGYCDSGGKMVDSELGMIPAGWRVGKLKELIDLHYGKGLKQSERTGTGYPVVGSSGTVDYHSSYLVKGPGIVIGRKGTLGKTIYLWDNFFPIDTTFYVESEHESEGLFFEYLLLQHIGFKEMNTDSAVPGLNKNIALGNQIVVPPTSIIHKFNRAVHPIFDKFHFNQSHVSILENQRNALLPKLMNGSARVDV